MMPTRDDVLTNAAIQRPGRNSDRIADALERIADAQELRIAMDSGLVPTDRLDKLVANVVDREP